MTTMLSSRAINFNKSIRLITLSSRNAVTQAGLNETVHDQTFTDVKPFNDLPGPKRWEVILGFLPGGRFNGKSLVEINTELRKLYGDIFMVPGPFGKRDLVYTFNPKDFQTVFRTEGPQPLRRGLDIILYYRKVLRSDIFKKSGGLVAEQGENWWHFRSTVNPVMMNPKSTTLYAPKMNKVADQFLEHIRKIRDPHTNEVPDNFVSDLNNWAFESVSLVALDKELGMISNSAGNPLAKKVIESMQDFFELLLVLDILPSLYRYIPTPSFKRCVQRLDDITELTTHYIDEALERLEQDKKNGVPPKPEHEQSVLERLVKIDRSIAIVMAMDMLMAGVDTTTSAMSAVLVSLSTNHEKQNKLREEIMKKLPNKSSEMTSENLKNLPYLRACIKEAFRLYPVSTGNFRTTGQDVVLSGYQVPKGTDISMPALQLMRDLKYYQRPTEYLPERWLRNSEKESTSGCPLNTKEPFLFLPFGFGQRICIGKRFVDLELEVGIAKLIRNYEIRFDYSTENLFRTHITNVPNKPLKFKFIDLKN